MKKNCLVTKLNGVVQNSNLPYIDGIRIKSFAQDTPDYKKRTIGMLVNGTTEIVVLSGDVYFTDSTGSLNLGKSITKTSSASFTLSNHNGEILVKNKGIISNINFGDFTDKTCAINLSDISYIGYNVPSSNVVSAIRWRTRAYGDISNYRGLKLFGFDLGGNTNATGTIPSDMLFGGLLTLSLCSIALDTTVLANSNITSFACSGNNNVTGNIANIPNLNLVGCVIESSGISGTIESYFQKFWTLGKRDGSATVRANGSKITFHNNTIGTLTTYSGAFSSSEIVVSVGGTTVATFNGSTWSYS